MADLHDDSTDFPAIERDYIRATFIPDWEWMAFDTPSPRIRPAVGPAEARIGLVSTAGAHPRGDRPLGSSGRALVIPLETEITLTHPGYDTERASQDPDVVYPVSALRGLVAEGEIAELVPTVLSTMGGTLAGTRIVERAVPAAVAWAQQEAIDLALLVPA